MAKASGKVVFTDGTPVTSPISSITFAPAEGSSAKVIKAGSAMLSDDGSFVIMTKKPGDGVFKGSYVVTFTVIADLNTGESLIPREYTRKSTSPFKVEVTEDKDDYLFELKPL